MTQTCHSTVKHHNVKSLISVSQGFKIFQRMSCGSLTIARFLECNSYCVSLAVWILVLFYKKTTNESYNNVLVAVSLISSYWYQLVFNLNVKRMPIGWLVESLAKNKKTWHICLLKTWGAVVPLGGPSSHPVDTAFNRLCRRGSQTNTWPWGPKLLAASLLRRNSRVNVHCL